MTWRVPVNALERWHDEFDRVITAGRDYAEAVREADLAASFGPYRPQLWSNDDLASEPGAVYAYRPQKDRP